MYYSIVSIRFNVFFSLFLLFFFHTWALDLHVNQHYFCFYTIWYCCLKRKTTTTKTTTTRLLQSPLPETPSSSRQQLTTPTMVEQIPELQFLFLFGVREMMMMIIIT